MATAPINESASLTKRAAWNSHTKFPSAPDVKAHIIKLMSMTCASTGKREYSSLKEHKQKLSQHWCYKTARKGVSKRSTLLPASSRWNDTSHKGCRDLGVVSEDSAHKMNNHFVIPDLRYRCAVFHICCAEHGPHCFRSMPCEDCTSKESTCLLQGTASAVHDMTKLGLCMDHIVLCQIFARGVPVNATVIKMWLLYQCYRTVKLPTINCECILATPF